MNVLVDVVWEPLEVHRYILYSANQHVSELPLHAVPFSSLCTQNCTQGEGKGKRAAVPPTL